MKCAFIVGCPGVVQLEGLAWVSPTKVKACKSFLFKEGSLKVESRKHLFDFVVTLYFNSLCSNALGSNKVYQQFENEEIISQLC